MKCLSKIGNDLSDSGNCLSDFGNNPHMQIARRMSDTGIGELGEWVGAGEAKLLKYCTRRDKAILLQETLRERSHCEKHALFALGFRLLTQLILSRPVAGFLVTFNPHQG